MREIQEAAIIGMGALGLLFGSEIADHVGENAVRFVADSDRVARYASQTFTINGVPRRFRVEDASHAKPADLVIVAVKYGALERALETMAGCVGPETIVISVMNGISSEKHIAARFPQACVLFSVAQGMDAMKFGTDLNFTKAGELALGDASQQEQLDALTRFFDRAGVPYQCEADIRHRLWSKFMLNVGANQTCMAMQTNYAGLLAPGEANETMLGAMHEVMALARTEGVMLSQADVDYYISVMRGLSPEGVPSMRQDALQKRPSEVEMFSGTVRAMSNAAGLSCPVNDWLYEKINLMESTY